MMKLPLAAVLICALAASGCRDRARDAEVGSEKPDTGGTLIVALTNEPDAVNTLLSGERMGQEITRNVLFLPLVQYNKELDVEPLLAESWQMSGDTAVTFKLRRDVKWHDGTPTTARDVVFTFERGRDPKTGYPNADYWAGWRSAQAIDSFTVRFSFDAQPEPLANLPWIPIMPAHLLEDIAPENLKNAPYNEKPVGNGPFKFVEHRPNDRWVFDANREFPVALGGRPLVDRLVMRVIPDPTAQETELRTGRVHFITNVSGQKYDEIDKLPGIRGVIKPGKQFLFVTWNNNHKPLDDVRVRRALAFAIDRENIVNVVRRSYGQVGVGPVPPFHWSNDTTIKPLPFSTDSARAYLAAAGITDRNNDGYVELPNGRPFTVELKYASASIAQRDAAEMMRSDLQKAGVRLEPRPLDFATVIGDVTDPARKYQAAILGFETDFKLVVHDMFHSRAIDNPYQFASYRNATVDSLLDRLSTTMSRDEAAPMWRRFQTVIRDEQPWTFLFYFPDLFAARDELKGPLGDIRGIFFGITKWWIDRPDSAAMNQ